MLVHNGWPVSTTNTPGTGVTVGPSGEVPSAADIVGSVLEGGDALVRLNDAYGPDVVVVDVPVGVRVEHPVLVVHWCDAVASAMFPRTCVRAQEESSVAVVEVFAGPAASSLVVPVTELAAARHASLSYVALQVLGEDAWSIARLAARGGADADVRTFTMGLGAAYDRVRADVAVDGRGATARSSPRTSAVASRCTTSGPCRTTSRQGPTASCCAKARWPIARARSTAV